MDDGQEFLPKLAVPSVALLISFLSYSSQILFSYLDPGQLEFKESILFNSLVLCLWISYARSWLTNPGFVPANWIPEGLEAESLKSEEVKTSPVFDYRPRFCRKCNTVKAPRSHHCKMCKRCIPKMDHHCPWTSNCVSHRTFPHFIRFLFYAVTAMSYLEYFIYVRALVIWENRSLPSYLGPSISQLIHFFLLITVNTFTLFMLSIMLFRALWTLGINVTTIESWEIERHEQLVRRARALGGYLDGPDGTRVKITKQEFPYDIGIWKNITQGLSTANVIAWFWPFAATPTTDGLVFEINEFEDAGVTWPPPDPDRIPRRQRSFDPQEAFTYQKSGLSDQEELAAFRERQQADFERRSRETGIMRRKPFYTRYKNNGTALGDEISDDEDIIDDGEEDWQDSGGNRLKDYGVEENVEFYDEADIPLAELLRRREQRQEIRRKD